MKTEQNHSLDEVPESVEAEAAAWVARLHNTERTSEDEASFQRWLTASAIHKAAFEGMSDAWEAASRLKSDVLSRQRLAPRSGGGTGRRMFALAAGLMAVTIGLMFFRHGAISTDVGERREMTLADGSRLTLNTSTQVLIEFDDRQRLVTLKRGEAFFDVAQRPDKPFIVQTPDSRITALGTAFSVRSEREKTQVTLIEGKVAVFRDSAPTTLSSKRVQQIVLSPGQRLTLASKTAPRIDEPQVEKVTAWRQGLIALEKTPLTDAVAEMNRYSRVKLVVGHDLSRTLQVSGIFHAGDSEDFAQGLADSHGLKVSRDDERITLSAN